MNHITPSIPVRSFRSAQEDKPSYRPRVDVVRERRHSPRSVEEVDLALSAIWELYAFIDGVLDKKTCLERNLDYMHLLYERYLEDSVISSLPVEAASRDRVDDRPLHTL